MKAWLAGVVVVAACGGSSSGKKPIDAALGGDGTSYDAPGDSAISDAAVNACACATTALGSTRGAAIAVTPDDKTVVTCNRDAGTVTIARADYTDGQPALTSVAELSVGTGSEPWQVAIDACGKCAYVVTRNAQKVVRIEGIDTATPTVGTSVAVGSEPVAVALSPNGTHLYAANFVEGTISVIDPVAMTVTSTIDLDAALIGTGLLGAGAPASSRPALAHPRALAMTNNGDASDADETLVATEFYAQRTAPESVATADTNWEGVVYKVAGGTVTPIALPPVTNTTFTDHTGATTGCFPNQVGAVAIAGSVAWVTSTCASPKGPLGVFIKGACQIDANCTLGAGSCVNGSCKGSCTLDADCGMPTVAGNCNLTFGATAGFCKPVTTDVKTTTHGAVSAIDLTANTATTTILDAPFSTAGSTRMPLSPSDIAFKGSFAYVTAEGADAAFRFTTSGKTITAFGASNNFIDLRKSGADTLIRLPVGIAIANGSAFAFAADDGSRDITALSLNSQAIAGDGTTDFRILQASALPTAGTSADHVLRGKRFFTTGLGRWSLSGAAWGSCAACHPDGLSDHVTWYFARGPRQSVSLDGTFASADATDMRMLNWGAINDEIADFEGNVRGVSGGVGALVSTTSSPPVTTDRINLLAESPQQLGLQGSSDDIANPAGTSAHPHSLVADWGDITAYIQAIRSPRAPVGLDANDVAAGRALFDSGQGNCVGCHSGAKWTISKRFYTPSDTPNDAFGSTATTSLGKTIWNANLNNFPSALFPSTTSGSQVMRFGAPPASEQLQCAVRPVGTYGTSSVQVNVLELTQNMATAAQGNAATGLGFNPPSLLGLSAGGPFFHAGNARTLEESLASTFSGHYQTAVAAVFAPSATQVRQLVAFMLSIDESTTVFAPPALGPSGGVLCHYP